VTLWSCPGAAAFWLLVTRWWKEWRGPSIRRELVLMGEGLKDLGKERRRVVWGVISEGKYKLWEWRTVCLKKKLLIMVPKKKAVWSFTWENWKRGKCL